MPALGFFHVGYMDEYSFVADRFQYLASIGILVPICVLLSKLFNRYITQIHFIRLFTFTVLLTILGTLTWQQGHIYKNNETIWRDTINKNPASYTAHLNLGQILAQRRNYADAFLLFKRAIEINPVGEGALYNMGVLYFSIGKFKEAKFYFSNALRNDSNKKDAKEAKNYMELLKNY